MLFRSEIREGKVDSRFSALEKTLVDCARELRGENWRHGVTDLRELARGRAEEFVGVRKSLQARALANGESAWDLRMQMRTPAAFGSARDDGLGGTQRVETIHAPEMITLAVIENHVAQQRFGFVFARLVVFHAGERAGNDRAARNVRNFGRGRRENFSTERAANEQTIAILRHLKIGGTFISQLMVYY